MGKRKSIFVGASQAPSTRNVAATISAVLRRAGALAPVFVPFDPNAVRFRDWDGGILVWPLLPHAARHVLGYYIFLKNIMRRNIYWYVMVEGYIPQDQLLVDAFYFPKYIAVSEYVREKLEQRGLVVEGVIPHGVDMELIQRVSPMAEEKRKELKAKYGDKVVITLVSSAVSRKNLDGFAEALHMLSPDVLSQMLLVLITEPKGMQYFADFTAAGYAITPVEFGKAAYEEVLTWIGASDYVVYPTQAEGFGLPIVEANAFGVPVIHAWFPPLTEVSDPAANITFPTLYVKDGELYYGLRFELHYYPPERLAEALKKAVDMYYNARDEYEARREAALKNAKRFDADVVYKRWLDLF